MSLNYINGVLSPEVFKIASTRSKLLYENTPLELSSNRWSKDILEFSKEVKIYELPKKDSLFNLIKKQVESLEGTTEVLGILFYFWLPGSYIPWHNDGYSYTNALTIYLNEDWKYNYGGLFQYELDGEIKTIIPKPNHGVLQIGDIEHATTITSLYAPIRKTIQIFFKKPEDDSTKSII